MFEPDLDELEERVSEMGEMLRDLGGHGAEVPGA